MVQGSLSLGIFLFPDLLRQSSWKVLTDDLIPMFVALVVLRNFFILQLVGQSAILSNKPLLTNFGDTTALRERVRHFHVRHFRDGEVSHFLSPKVKPEPSGLRWELFSTSNSALSPRCWKIQCTSVHFLSRLWSRLATKIDHRW